jgi:hypothetical protein
VITSPVVDKQNTELKYDDMFFTEGHRVRWMRLNTATVFTV